MSFVHLHTHSHYSFLMGTPSPKDLVSRAKKLSFSSIAMTDSSNVCGLVEFVEAAEKEKIKAIIGSEVWIVDGESEKSEEPSPGFQIVLLVEDEEGWRNLCQILTIAHRNRNFSPRVRPEELSGHRNGLIALTGNQYGVFKSEDSASNRLSLLMTCMGKDRVEVEVIDHGKELDESRNRLAVELAKKEGLPILVTNDVRYLEAEEVGVLETMAKVGLGESPVIGPFIETDQAWLKTEQEMSELFPPEWLERTQTIADRCSFVLPRGKPMLPRVDPSETLEQIISRFPPSKLLPAPDLDSTEYKNNTGSWKILDGSSSKPVDRYFRWLCREGLRVRLEEEKEAERFGSREDYEKQLEFECGVIEGMEYVVYHLMVSEFTNWAKDNGIAVGPGRGSAAGSIAVWSLRITDVNPKQFGLFFERFLNPERRGLPDIDMDFEKLRRDKVIAHVRERYGEECVAQILTIGKMKAKAALKDAARACSIHFVESNYWSNFVDDGPKAKLKDSLGQGYLKALRDGSPLFKRVSDLALSLEGKPRQQGIHAAGVIIASDPVSRFCPMHYVPQDQIVCTGLDMDAAEKVGLVKFDFLGLKTLDVIQECIRAIEEKTGKTPQTIDPLFDDPEVFNLMKRGETDGLFQIESPGMTRLIRKLVPENFEEVICLLALYRPGPLKSGMVSSWIERKHGREKVESVHPLLDEVLGPTYGLIVYQEQALSTARILAGFSLGQADLLRRAIGKKKPEEMKQQREAFVRGCWETNQISEAEATRVFNLIDYFSGYSFNKCIDISTPVLTSRGIVRADEVVVGDEIVQFSNGEAENGRVRRVWPIEYKERIRIEFEGGDSVVCTREHRFVDFDTGEEIRADRAASEGRRLAFVVWDGLSDSSAEAEPSQAMRGVPEEKEGDSFQNHVEGMGRPSGVNDGQCVGDRKEDIGQAGHSGRKGRKTEEMEEREQGGLPREMHEQNAGGQERDGTQRIETGDVHLKNASVVRKKCASEGGGNRKADRLRWRIPSRGGWTAPLQTNFWSREVRTDEVSGSSPERMGNEQKKDPCSNLYRMLHQLRGSQTDLEGASRADTQESISWTVSPRKPVRVTSLPVGPVVDLEVGGDHLYVLGNGLISHNSHSAAYAIVTYITAKLKTYFPAEFMAATMTMDMGDKDKIRQYTSAVQKSGNHVLRPDIQTSRIGFTAEDRHVRFGLGAIRGVGEAALAQICAHRPYSSIEDLMERAQISSSVAESLVWSGALDSIERDRFEAWWKIKRPKRKKLSKKVAPGQMLLFSGKTAGEDMEEQQREADFEAMPPRPTEMEISLKEANALGVSLGVHPLHRFDDVKSKIQTHGILQLMEIGHEKTPFVLAARIEEVSIEEDKRGGTVAIMTVEDTESSLRVVLREPVLRGIDKESLLKENECIVLHGTASSFEEDELMISIDRIESLWDFRWRVNRSVRIQLWPSDEKNIDKICQIVLDGHESGTHDAYLEVRRDTETSWAKMSRKILPTRKMAEDLERLTGRPDVVRIPSQTEEKALVR